MLSAPLMRSARRRAVLVLLLALAATAPVAAQPVVHGVSVLPTPPLTSDVPAQFSVDASVPGGGALEYRWDFGDGSPRTPWLAVPDVQHGYSTPGVYTLLVQVRHASQGLAAATHVVVVRLPGAAAARASTPVAVHPTRREVWALNPDHGSVAVVDADTLALLDEVPVGAHPASIAFDAAGHAWVAVRDEDALVRIDPASGAVSGSIALGHGARPAGLVVAGGTGYVVLAGPGTLLRFDALAATAGDELVLGAHADALALAGDGSALYASRLVSQGEAGTLWKVPLPAFDHAVAIALPLDSTSPDSGTAARGLPNYVGALALAEDHATLWYGGKKDNILRGLHREGQPLTFESVLRTLVGRVDAAVGLEAVAARLDIDDGGRVSALLAAPGSSHLFAAQETNNRVLVLDGWNRRELARVEVGRAPQGLAYDPLQRRLWVQAMLSRRLDAFDVGPLLDDGVTPPLPAGTVATTSTEVLAPEVLAGKRVFYNAADARMSQDGYIACVSCHLDGRQDGRTWDFTQLGEGLRNTTALRGNAGLGRGLLHWSGNFDEVQDFEVPIRNLFGGLGFLDDAEFATHGPPLGAPKAGLAADLDALAAYVASLDQDDRSPFRDAAGALDADGVAGRALFEQLDCQRCHAGAAFTDSATGLRHDVGTLGAGSGTRLGGALLALDTPTLRGLFDSAPYLHDGSATTLEDVLVAANPDGAHGAVDTLSDGERAQLLAFLLQIDGGEPALGPPAQLALASPLAGAQLAPQQAVTLSISTDLPRLLQVDYLADGELVASATQAPWSAQWLADGRGAVALHARVHHDHGRFRTLSPALAVTALPTALFRDSFEPAQ